MGDNRRVVIFGEILVDLFSETPTAPARGVRAFAYAGKPGGAPANVAANLAFAGLPVSFVGSFSDDPIGAELRSMLAERDIDLTWSPIHAGSRTPMAMVLTKPGGERTFRLYLAESALEQISVQDVDKAALHGASWFHFGSVLMAFVNPKAVTLHLLQEARNRGLTVSYDINVRPDIWKGSSIDPQTMLDVLRQVDVIKCSDEDLAWLQDNVAPDLKTPEDLLQYGCKLVAYTRGKEGATFITDAFTLPVPAPAGPVIDTTGAGDAFMAGLIIRFSRHGGLKLDIGSLKAAGESAVSCAGRILGQRGAMPV